MKFQWTKTKQTNKRANKESKHLDYILRINFIFCSFSVCTFDSLCEKSKVKRSDSRNICQLSQCNVLSAYMVNINKWPIQTISIAAVRNSKHTNFRPQINHPTNSSFVWLLLFLIAQGQQIGFERIFSKKKKK